MTFFDYKLKFDQVAASRGDLTLFDGLSFELCPGQLIWLHGANGSGKTTILTLATGFRVPTSGEVTWSETDEFCAPEDIVVYQGHQDALKSDLTVSEDLEFWIDTYNSEQKLSDILSLVQLTERRDLRCGQLSAGQKRRLSIARLIISEKPVWIMDEPMAAIDKSGQDLILNLITEHVRSGGAVLLATHRLLRSLGISAQSLSLELS